jgi:hypothetical protein
MFKVLINVIKCRADIVGRCVILFSVFHVDAELSMNKRIERIE